MRQENVLASARFDPKLPYYMMLSTLFVLGLTCVGIPFIPIWLIFGWSFHRKQWERMECDLTERSLNIRRGVLFRVEKNIPLDKIQDLAMKEGPLLRHLGLAALAVETAGGSQAQGSADATLSGVVDAPAFRDAVLDQRDRVVASAAAPASAAAVEGRTGADGVLLEIRDSLRRIEGLLEQRDR